MLWEHKVICFSSTYENAKLVNITNCYPCKHLGFLGPMLPPNLVSWCRIGTVSDFLENYFDLRRNTIWCCEQSCIFDLQRLVTQTIRNHLSLLHCIKLSAGIGELLVAQAYRSTQATVFDNCKRSWHMWEGTKIVKCTNCLQVWTMLTFRNSTRVLAPTKIEPCPKLWIATQ
jgi:hypothetical protein